MLRTKTGETGLYAVCNSNSLQQLKLTCTTVIILLAVQVVLHNNLIIRPEAYTLD